jgi:hypothetical protein
MKTASQLLPFCLRLLRPQPLRVPNELSRQAQQGSSASVTHSADPGERGLHFGAVAARLRAMKTADAFCITAGIIIR